MKTLIDLISNYFKNDTQFNWIIQSVHAQPAAGETLVDYFNPARPSLIQVISESELSFFRQLSSYAQWQELDRLHAQHVQFLIVCDDLPLPEILTRQNFVNIIHTDKSAPYIIQLIENKYASEFYPSEIVQGGMLVVENQGIIITGSSGIGKSQLLLSLLERGHLWISDELTHCYKNSKEEVYGKAVEDLASFSHIKGIGPVNIDKTFGLSKRLPNAPLAGVIHLGENNAVNNHATFAYEQKLNKSILGQHFQTWLINPATNNLEIMIETCARQLILSRWGQHAAGELEQELKNTLCETL